MDTYGLIGKNLTHSFSPAYFKRKFKHLGLDTNYRMFELKEISQFPELLQKNPKLKGLSVTAPYKIGILPFLNELDEIASQAGSVNTIKICRNEGTPVLKGFNTDIIGFEKTLLPLVSDRENRTALILGTGGAANAVEFVLNKLQIPFSFVSRNPLSENHVSYSGLTKEIIKSHKLIINTTPKGMFPDVDESPAIPYQFIDKEHILYDLIYNPAETVFLKHGREKGCVTMNGLKMLELQADAAWEIWNSRV